MAIFDRYVSLPVGTPRSINRMPLAAMAKMAYVCWLSLIGSPHRMTFFENPLLMVESECLLKKRFENSEGKTPHFSKLAFYIIGLDESQLILMVINWYSNMAEKSPI